MISAEHLAFTIMRRIREPRIPTAPCFGSDEATTWFLGQLQHARRYLEYGSGGSTYAAAKFGVEFLTIDSDPDFLDAVRAKVASDHPGAGQRWTFHYADIGPTTMWGRPLNWTTAPPHQLDMFRRYSDPPMECRAGGALPDLVLVDGRFRVACALKALRMLASGGGEWTIVVDDYVDRPEYHSIAEFAEIDQCVANRVAVIHSARPFDLAELNRAIHHYEILPQ